ncbi:MAG: hypothetical protein KDB68_09660 [Planctomycetes bacterium]|nr:hypothetical protein [Planctomycetota bacterium]
MKKSKTINEAKMTKELPEAKNAADGSTLPKAKFSLGPAGDGGKPGADVGRVIQLESRDGPCLMKALEALPADEAYWISPHVWQGEKRRGKDWDCADMIMLDLDLREGSKKRALDTGSLRNGLKACRDAAMQPNIVYQTPHGLRVAFLLPDTIDNPEEYKDIAKTAAAQFQEELNEAGVGNTQPVGFHVDNTHDLARVFWPPNCVLSNVNSETGETGSITRKAKVFQFRTPPHSIRNLVGRGGGMAKSPGSASSVMKKGEVVEILLRYVRNAELGVDQFARPVAMEPNLAGGRAVDIRSEEFAGFLLERFLSDYNAVPQEAAMREAIGAITRLAKLKGSTVETHIRVASERESVTVDLANEDGTFLEVNADGIRHTDSPAARFMHLRDLKPLPVPAETSSAESLFELLRAFNIKDLVSQTLTIGCLLSWFIRWAAQPILHLQGPQGCGKSTATRMLLSFLMPGGSGVTLPSSERDLLVAAANMPIVAYDNVSVISPAMSDSLCRLATGSGMQRRGLYTDMAIFRILVRRPIVLNSITDVVERADLADRVVKIRMAAVEPADRMKESSLQDAYEELFPSALGALLHGVQTCLKRLPDVRVKELPRLADFAAIVEAASPAFGWDENHFTSTMFEVQQQAKVDRLMDMPLVPPLLELLGEGPFAGSATQLHAELTDRVPDRRPSDWPGNAQALSRLLEELAPDLEELGIYIHRERTSDSRRLRIERDVKFDDFLIEDPDWISEKLHDEDIDEDDFDDLFT